MQIERKRNASPLFYFPCFHFRKSDRAFPSFPTKCPGLLGPVFLERIGIVASLGNATRDAPYSCLEAPNHHNSRRGKWNRKGIGSVGIYVRTEG